MSIGVIRRLAARRDRGRGDTEYLLSSPVNARRLLAALEDSRSGKGTRYTSLDALRRELGL